LASWIAARKVHDPSEEAQIPFPGFTSPRSSALFTTKVAALACEVKNATAKHSTTPAALPLFLIFIFLFIFFSPRTKMSARRWPARLQD
jgi:hypothetical protein